MTNGKHTSFFFKLTHKLCSRNKYENYFRMMAQDVNLTEHSSSIPVAIILIMHHLIITFSHLSILKCSFSLSPFPHFLIFPPQMIQLKNKWMSCPNRITALFTICHLLTVVISGTAVGSFLHWLVDWNCTASWFPPPLRQNGRDVTLCCYLLPTCVFMKSL